MNRVVLAVAIFVSFGISSANADSFVIDFETVPGGSPLDGLAISNQFESTYGVTFSLEGGGNPVMAQVGAPRTAFNGIGGAADNPAPGQNVGSFFLTDDGDSPTAPQLLSYLTTRPCPTPPASFSISICRRNGRSKHAMPPTIFLKPSY